MTTQNLATRFTVNLVYGTHGESGILTSIHNTKQMVTLSGRGDIELYENAIKLCDLLDVQTFGPGALLYVLAYRLCRKKVVIHAHTTPEDMKNSYRGANLLNKLMKWYLSFYYNLADVCIVPSAYTKKVLIDALKVKKRVEVLSNGIDLTTVHCESKNGDAFRQRFGLHTDPVALSVGFVFIRKGISDFVEVAKRLPQFRFVWVGRILPDALLSRATKDVVVNSPNNVTFTGRIDQISEALSAADVFIFPSYEENQGLAALEAAACGLPVILRTLPVYSEYEHDINCLKFDTIDDLAEAIKQLIDDKPKAERLGKEAQKMAQMHDVRRLSSKLLRIYCSSDNADFR